MTALLHCLPLGDAWSIECSCEHASCSSLECYFVMAAQFPLSKDMVNRSAGQTSNAH